MCQMTPSMIAPSSPQFRFASKNSNRTFSSLPRVWPLCVCAARPCTPTRTQRGLPQSKTPQPPTELDHLRTTHSRRSSICRLLTLVRLSDRNRFHVNGGLDTLARRQDKAGNKETNKPGFDPTTTPPPDRAPSNHHS